MALETMAPEVQQDAAIAESKTAAERGHYSNIVSKFLQQSANVTRMGSLRNRENVGIDLPSSRNAPRYNKGPRYSGFSAPRYVGIHVTENRLVRKGVPPGGGEAWEKDYF